MFLQLQLDVFMTYGRGTAFVVGMVHGVGAETPTQILLFLAVVGAGGKAREKSFSVCSSSVFYPRIR